MNQKLGEFSGQRMILQMTTHERITNETVE